jgi:superfamily II DNA or RNA helicase/intein/homing endonuclease
MKKMSVSLNRWSAHPYFFINGDLDFRVIRALTREMSYFVEGFERTKKYKEGRWDGQECLLYKSKKGVYFFPVGMIDVVKRVFGDFEVEYFIQDIKLKDVQKKYKSLDLKWTGHELRDYQMKAVMDIKNNEGGTICLPTGAGKTLIMIRLIYEYNLPCLIIVHTKELLYQWEKNIKAYLNGRCPGIIGDGNMSFDPITVAMMQTLSQKIVKEKMENLDYPIIFADECHRAPADTAYLVMMHCNAPVRIGASVSGNTVVTVRKDGCISRIPIQELCALWEHGECGFETPSVNSRGRVEWAPVKNVWKIPYYDRMYRVRGGRGSDITLTRDHSIMVYDTKTATICEKTPTELTGTDHLIKLCVSEYTESNRNISLFDYANENHYVYLKQGVSLQKLYDYKIGNRSLRYCWKMSNSLPVWAARKIGIAADGVSFITAHQKRGGIPPIVSSGDFYKFLGLYLADGTIDPRGRVDFYTQDKEIYAFNRILTPICSNIKVSKRSDGEHFGGKGVILRVGSKALVDVLSNMGIHNGGKYVPGLVMSDSFAYRSFVDGVIVGDGHISTGRNAERIQITTSKIRIARDLEYMISCMGFAPSVYKRISSGGLDRMKQKKYVSYVVSYQQTTGRTDGRGKHRWRKYIPCDGLVGRLWGDIQRKEGNSYGDLRLTEGISGRKTISSDLLRRILGRSKRSDLKWLLENDVAFTSITSIEECDNESFVYDISTEGETFLGGNVFCHNSATPTRTDGAQIKIWACCGEIKTTITADTLIKRGILAKPEFVFLTPPPVYCGKRAHYPDVYLQGIVINEGRNDMIIKKAMEYAGQGLITYIHVERIDHGEMLKERIPGSVFLSGRDGTTVRQGVLKKFVKGDIKILISTLLKEGVDIPAMNVFIAAGAGKSPIGVLQKAGRALRVAPGKTSAIIVDFRDSGKYLGDHWSDRYNIYKSTFGEYCP